MAKYGQLEVNVKVFESKMKPAATAKGGVFQNIGNCQATIIVGETVLFEHFSGRVSRLFNTKEDFKAGTNARLIIDYGNSYKSNAGAYVDQTKPSNDLQAILEVETMKTFAKGFSKSERDETNAKATGMDIKDYTNLMNSALTAAGNIEGELVEKSESQLESGKSELDQLNKDIG